MTGAVARRELREARKKGFCGFCFAKGPAGFVLVHKSNCKAVTHAGSRRRRTVRS